LDADRQKLEWAQHPACPLGSYQLDGREGGPSFAIAETIGQVVMIIDQAGKYIGENKMGTIPSWKFR
jgi:hypothetical protein